MKYIYKDEKFALNRIQILSPYKGGRIMEGFKKMQILVVRFFFIVATMTLGITSITYADGGLPYTFHSGQTISSDQVNTDFQALLTRIEALEVQLAPASIVGTYDFVGVGARMLISYPYNNQQNYSFIESGGRATFVFKDNGTFTGSQTDGGYYQMDIINVIFTVPQVHDLSYITGIFSQGGPDGNVSGTYTVSGSTVTTNVGIVGSLSADGKILIFSHFNSTDKQTGLLIGMRHQ